MTSSNPYTNNDSNTRCSEAQIALAHLIVGMSKEGYTDDAPSAETEEKDGKLVSRLACRKCKAGPGSLTYIPFTLWDYIGEASSYRSFTICEKCGSVSEF